MNFFNNLHDLLRKFVAEYVTSVSLDLVILGFQDGSLKVLLLKVREVEEWFLPGGRIRKDESLEAAAYRTLRTRTSLDNLFLQQFHTFGDPDRMVHFAETLNKQAKWSAFLSSLSEEESAFLTGRSLSVGFYALIDYTTIDLTSDFLTEECRWWNVSEVPDMVMDHANILSHALKSLRRQLTYQPVGYNLLPEKFTMTELQTLYETILNKSLDRRNFHKLMMSYGILERLEKRPTSSGKSPYLYRFIKNRYEEILLTETLFIG